MQQQYAGGGYLNLLKDSLSLLYNWGTWAHEVGAESIAGAALQQFLDHKMSDATKNADAGRKAALTHRRDGVPTAVAHLNKESGRYVVFGTDTKTVLQGPEHRPLDLRPPVDIELQTRNGLEAIHKTTSTTLDTSTVTWLKYEEIWKLANLPHPDPLKAHEV